MKGSTLLLRDERYFAHEQQFGFIQNTLGRFHQAFAMLGRHHAAPAAHQQLISGQFAQLAQRGGDGRLWLVQLYRDTGDIPLTQ